MLAIQDISIDETAKPAIEWINGKAVQKQPSTDWHAFLQLAFARCIYAWAKSDGKVGTEWRFTVPTNAYQTKSLVPDVAYITKTRYFALPPGDRTYPPIPPEIVVEILSPDDLATKIAIKRRVYLWWGVKLVIIVDPESRTVETHEFEGIFKTFSQSETLISAAFPTLALPLREIFAEIGEPG